MTIHDAFNAYPDVYKAYREGLHYADEAARWSADYYNIRDAQPRQVGGAGSGDIAGRAQGTIEEVSKRRSEVMLARVKLGKLRVEL